MPYEQRKDGEVAEQRGSGARDWTVLLIGGGSGVGKSTLAREIARRTGAALAHADDYRMALERVLTPEQNASLHAFAQGGPESLGAEAAVRAWRRIGQVVSHALEVVVAHHVFGHEPLVIEGDALLPSFAAQAAFAGYAVSSGLRSLYVVERELAQVRENLHARGRDWRMGPDGLERYARASWEYGLSLAEEASALGLPVLDVRPWEDLPRRALEVLEAEAVPALSVVA